MMGCSFRYYFVCFSIFVECQVYVCMRVLDVFDVSHSSKFIIYEHDDATGFFSLSSGHVCVWVHLSNKSLYPCRHAFICGKKGREEKTCRVNKWIRQQISWWMLNASLLIHCLLCSTFVFMFAAFLWRCHNISEIIIFTYFIKHTHTYTQVWICENNFKKNFPQKKLFNEIALHWFSHFPHFQLCVDIFCRLFMISTLIFIKRDLKKKKMLLVKPSE